MPDLLRFRFIDGPKSGETIEIREHDTLLFGRAEECDVRLPADDPTASRLHFLLEANPPVARVKDLGSLAGTVINGIKHGGRESHESPEKGGQRSYPEVALSDGDELRIGAHVIRVEVEIDSSCGRCGKQIPSSELEASRWTGGGLMCPECQVDLAEGTGPPSNLPKCANCGGAFPEDLHRVLGGGELCPACAPKEDVDLVALLMKELLAWSAAAEEPVPDIADYEVESTLGMGGFGAVYLARNRLTGERVALKVMLARVAVDEQARKRFLREMEMHRDLDHPNILKITDFGSAGSTFYFTSEYCDAGSVKDLMIRNGGKLAIEQATPIIAQALEGLAFAHNAGRVHRDIKPDNLLLKSGGGQLTVLVGDLGLTKSFDEAGFTGITHTEEVIGDWRYAPREQAIIFKGLKPPSDVFAIGATIFEMLTGELPRTPLPGQDWFDVVLSTASLRVHDIAPYVPDGVAAVVDKSLQMRPGDRYADAGEMLAAFKQA